jgi:glycosyltransferase involved in cell wall biosynthesis
VPDNGHKGQLAAIEATRRLRDRGHDVRLRLVGDGDVAACAAAIARHGLGAAVTLAGFVAELDAEYRRADVVLSCSPIEGMGRTTAEGMSYALPVVGCDSLATPELLEHYVSGLLCDGSGAGIAAALHRLRREPDLGRRLGRRARAVAQARFTDEGCAAACLAVLARVAAPGRVSERAAACGAG